MRKVRLGILCLLLAFGAAHGQRANDSIPKRKNRYYISLPLQFGFVSYQLDPVASSVSFPYSYASSPTSYTYSGSLNTGGFKALAPIFGFSLEGGFTRGLGMNIQGALINTIKPVGSSLLIDVTLLYNIKLTPKLTLQPAMGIGLVDSNINYPQSIDNRNKDILIYGLDFPYAYFQYSRNGSHYIYSDQTTVSLKDRKDEYIGRLTLRYRPLSFLTFGVSLTAFVRAGDETFLNIANKGVSADVKIPDPRYTFQSSSFGNDLFQLNWLNANVFVAFYGTR